MAKFINYADVSKKVGKKSDLGKKLETITKKLEDSRKAGKKDPMKFAPQHAKLLQSSIKDLTSLKKDN